MLYYVRQFFHYLTYPIRAVFASPRALLAAPKKLLGLSLPARVALFVALVLLLATLTAIFTYIWGDIEGTYWDVWFRWPRVVLIPVLLVIIPVVVYYALKLWLEGEQSAYPDIDAAWRAGIDALRKQDLDIQDIPIYLVVGAGNETQAHDILSASRIEFDVDHVPEGGKALHWYANSEAIYLSCTKASCLGLLGSRSADDEGHAAQLPASDAQAADNIRGTIIAGAGGNFGAAAMDMGQPAGSPAVGAPNIDIRGTMVIGKGEDQLSDLSTDALADSPGNLPKLLTREADEQADRLRYVCGLLSRARQPVCPINGVITLLPFHVLRQSDSHGSEVLVAARADLETVGKAVRLRCPVIALVGGMETQSGFRELVRRVGPDAARKGRFGKGYNVWSQPSDEQVEAVARNACGAFEDFSYHLFMQKDGLSHKGNSRLYRLLCLIRNRLEQRLVNIFVGGYAQNGEGDEDRAGLMFGGCYFAATGDKQDRQAFVWGVLHDRLVGNALYRELEWKREALAEDARYQRFANFLTIVCGLLVLASVGLFIAWLTK